MKVLVTGSSGMVGSALCSFLKKHGHEVKALVRGFLDPNALEGADVVVHLAGESLSKGFWTHKKKEKIYQSRYIGTKQLVEALEKLKSPPKVFISASAVGYYQEKVGRIGEDALAGNSFLSQVCKAWEEAAVAWHHPNTRVAIARLGYILSRNGGLLQALKPVFSLGLGAVMGGEQYMPWVALEDVVLALYHIMQVDELTGAVNIVSPHPVTQTVFSKLLAKVLHRPCLLKIPRCLILGEKMRALLLPSLEVYPDKLQKSGFAFTYTTLEQTLKHELFK
jgi:uncharacterized protein (TIGR01777 family)